MTITLNGSPLPGIVSSFRPIPFEIKRTRRTADGTLKTDHVAQKKTISIGFGDMYGSEKAVLDMLFAAAASMTLVYQVNGVDQTKTVQFADRGYQEGNLIIDTPSQQVWQGVSITLEEV
jgi:hypothetical protein